MHISPWMPTILNLQPNSQRCQPTRTIMSEWEVFKALDTLKSTSTGPHSLPAWFLRLWIPPPVNHLHVYSTCPSLHQHCSTSVETSYNFFNSQTVIIQRLQWFQTNICNPSHHTNYGKVYCKELPISCIACSTIQPKLWWPICRDIKRLEARLASSPKTWPRPRAFGLGLEHMLEAEAKSSRLRYICPRLTSAVLLGLVRNPSTL